jgi:hypothetical protein
MIRATPIVVTSAGPKPDPAKAESTPNSPTPGLHSSPAAIPDTHTIKQPPLGPILADPVLGLFADILDDLESVRIANANRLRQLTDTSEHGHGLSLHSQEVKRLASLVATLEESEHQAVLNLQRAMRAHPLGAWVKQTRGVGEKQAARLLAAIRDPYWNDLHQRPRIVSELWAYCGLHVVHLGGQEASAPHVDGAAGVAPTRRRGQKANWNNQARQRVWLIAASCIKCADSPYRDVYDAERAKYADAVHAAPCPRCGPAGKPAQPGSPLSAGHQHGRAMRRMCKEILRDLWREAARIHTEAADA